MQSMSYAEIMARREKRKQEEIAFATRRPLIPKNYAGAAMQILILQWQIDEIYKQWRAAELERAQASKIVIKAKKPRGRGRTSDILEKLGLA